MSQSRPNPIEALFDSIYEISKLSYKDFDSPRSFSQQLSVILSNAGLETSISGTGDGTMRLNADGYDPLGTEIGREDLAANVVFVVEPDMATKVTAAYLYTDHARKTVLYNDDSIEELTPEAVREQRAEVSRVSVTVGATQKEVVPVAVTRTKQLSEDTDLRAGEARTVALKEWGMTHQQIADLLDITKGSVDATSSKANSRVEQASMALFSLDEVHALPLGTVEASQSRKDVLLRVGKVITADRMADPNKGGYIVFERTIHRNSNQVMGNRTARTQYYESLSQIIRDKYDKMLEMERYEVVYNMLTTCFTDEQLEDAYSADSLPAPTEMDEKHH